ncbi:MAG TPA: hypothetical protein VJB06_01770, partial [archaeon]|nr:hypothetical protein [archaeon]
FDSLGITVKVVVVRALQDNKILGVDITVSKIGSVLPLPTPTPQIKISPRYGSVDSTNPLQVGPYKLYAVEGSDNSWVKVSVKDSTGKEVGSDTINKGNLKNFDSLGITVKVISVRALQDNSVLGSELLVVQAKSQSFITSITPENPVVVRVFGYNIYAAQASDKNWVKLSIKDSEGKEVATGTIDNLKSKDFTNIGLSVYVFGVSATQDGQPIKIDLVVHPISVSGVPTPAPIPGEPQPIAVFGDYKIYSTFGSDNSWAKIIIKDISGKEVGTAAIDQGSSRDFEDIGFSVKIESVRATQDGVVIGVEAKATPLTKKEKKPETVKDLLEKRKQILADLKQKLLGADPKERSEIAKQIHEERVEELKGLKELAKSSEDIKFFEKEKLKVALDLCKELSEDDEKCEKEIREREEKIEKLTEENLKKLERLQEKTEAARKLAESIKELETAKKFKIRFSEDSEGKVKSDIKAREISEDTIKVANEKIENLNLDELKTKFEEAKNKFLKLKSDPNSPEAELKLSAKGFLVSALDFLLAKVEKAKLIVEVDSSLTEGEASAEISKLEVQKAELGRLKEE